MRDGLPIAPSQKPEWIFVKARACFNMPEHCRRARKDVPDEVE
jgi:hypothetical protein